MTTGDIAGATQAAVATGADLAAKAGDTLLENNLDSAAALAGGAVQNLQAGNTV